MKLSPEQVDQLALQAGSTYGIDPRVLKALWHQESGFNPSAKSPVGAAGLGQLMPATAKTLGVKDRLDPTQNAFGSAKYLRQQLDEFGGNIDLALAAYNAGPGAVKKYGAVPPYKETQNYVNSIKSKLGPMGLAPQLDQRVLPDQALKGPTGPADLPVTPSKFKGMFAGPGADEPQDVLPEDSVLLQELQQDLPQQQAPIDQNLPNIPLAQAPLGFEENALKAAGFGSDTSGQVLQGPGTNAGFADFESQSLKAAGFDNSAPLPQTDIPVGITPIQEQPTAKDNSPLSEIIAQILGSASGPVGAALGASGAYDSLTGQPHSTIGAAKSLGSGLLNLLAQLPKSAQNTVPLTRNPDGSVTLDQDTRTSLQKLIDTKTDINKQRENYPGMALTGDLGTFIAGSELTGVPALPKELGFVAKMLASAPKGAAEMGIFDALLNPKSTPESVKTSAEYGAAGGPVGELAGKALEGASGSAQRILGRFIKGKNSGEIAKQALEYPRLLRGSTLEKWQENIQSVIAENSAGVQELLNKKYASKTFDFANDLGRSKAQIKNIANDLFDVAQNIAKSEYGPKQTEEISRLLDISSKLEKNQPISLADADFVKSKFWDAANFSKAGEHADTAKADAAFNLATDIRNKIDDLTDKTVGKLNRETHVAYKLKNNMIQKPLDTFGVGTVAKTLGAEGIGAYLGIPGLATATALGSVLSKTPGGGQTIAKMLNALGRQEAFQQGASKALPAVFKKLLGQ